MTSHFICIYVRTQQDVRTDAKNPPGRGETRYDGAALAGQPGGHCKRQKTSERQRLAVAVSRQDFMMEIHSEPGAHGTQVSSRPHAPRKSGRANGSSAATVLYCSRGSLTSASMPLL